MSESLKLTSAASLQAFVQQFDFNLLQKMFLGFHSAAFITAHEGVKGKKILTELITNGPLVRRFKTAFEPVQDAFEFKPNTLEVFPAKIDLQIYPQEYETTYLGLARQKGFNHNENPFEAHMLAGVLMQLGEEQETAVWQGIKAAVPADDDNLSEMFDGFLKIIADGLTATSITAVNTGSLTLADMVEQTESVYNGLPPAMRLKEVLIYMSVDNWALYAQSYRENYSKHYMRKEINGLELIKLDAGNAWIVPVAGMGTSDRIIATVKPNMCHGYDSASDTMLNFEDDKRAIDMWADFKQGCQIGILHNNMIRVNNQA